MARIKWSQDELIDLTNLTWTEFHHKYPTRSYDSWEVKRRRIPSGSAGTRVVVAQLVEREHAVQLARGVLKVVEDWVKETESRGV
jgi:hypothetical protein